MSKFFSPIVESLKVSPLAASVGEQVSAECTVSSHPPAKISFQWNLDGAPITGATSIRIDAPAAGRLTVHVTAVNNRGTAEAESEPVIVTARLEPPQVIEPPRIGGIPEAGQILRIESDGLFSGIPAPSVARVWQRDGRDISGATGTAYQTLQSDIGAQIALRVVATNAQGSATATSAAVSIGAAAAPDPEPEPAPRYYVATTGNDANDGSLSRPLRTISRAAALARPGDRIAVRGGTYRELVRVGTSGIAGAPIALAPFGDEHVVIDGSSGPGDTDLVVITGSHVSFRGFDVRGATRSGIAAWGGRHLRIVGNRVSGCTRGGIWVGHNVAGTAHSNEITDNIVFGNCLVNQARKTNGGWPVALGLAVSDRTVVRRNRVFDNYGEGIGALSTYDVEITDNFVYDNFSVMIYLDNAPRSVVRRNTIFHTGKTEFFRFNRPADGVLIANEFTAIQLPSSNITVVENTLAGLREPYYGDFEFGGGLKDSVIAPNTILPASAVNPAWLQF